MLQVVAMRTGRVKLHSSVEFNILLPDGTVLTNVWSPPWSGVSCNDQAQDAGAIEYGRRVYAQRRRAYRTALCADVFLVDGMYAYASYSRRLKP